ncbi:MAG: DUF3563 family protein [Tabrizicola sp.]|nr:DUF3563 family protein [Tabrizicola sp.]
MYKLFMVLTSGRSAPTEAERELAYLNASISLADLERRQREIEQGLLRHRRIAY